MKGRGIQTPIWETNLEGYTGAWVIASLVGGQLGPNAFYDMYTGKTRIDSAAMVKAYQGYQSSTLLELLMMMQPLLVKEID